MAKGSVNIFSHKRINILLATPEESYCKRMREAAHKSPYIENLHYVHDGHEVFEYLLRIGQDLMKRRTKWPDLILLDVDMHKMGGMETLRVLKSHEELKAIPVILFSDVRHPSDIHTAYGLGCNAFILKSNSTAMMTQRLSVLGEYWSRVVTLPPLAVTPPLRFYR